MKNDEIRKAFDRLTPDEETKERMLRNIMMRSAEMKQETSAKPVIVPWYVRLRIPMGISAAAAACAMVFTLASNNPELVQNGASRQDMLETKPAVTAAVTEVTTLPVSETEPVEETVQTTAITSTAAQTTTAAVENLLNTSSTSVITTAAPKPVTSEVVTTPASTEAAVSTTVEIVTTTAETVVTTEPVTTTNAPETTVTTTTVSIKPSLYGDLFDFNHVTWAGRSYDTDYEIVAYEDLANHLGSGVAVGDEVSGSYTILLYAIKGVPVEQGFAVQYAGQYAYYLFYNID